MKSTMQKKNQKIKFVVSRFDFVPGYIVDVVDAVEEVGVVGVVVKGKDSLTLLLRS